MSNNILNKNKIYLECFVTRVIEQAIIDAREKMAIKSLKNVVLLKKTGHKDTYRDCKTLKKHCVFEEFTVELFKHHVFYCIFQ